MALCVGGSGALYPSCMHSLTSPQKLEELNKFPDFNNYLIFVLTKLTSEGECVFKCLYNVVICYTLRDFAIRATH
jgi:hypothetical protein